MWFLHQIQLTLVAVVLELWSAIRTFLCTESCSPDAAHKSFILSERKTRWETFSSSALKRRGSVGMSKRIRRSLQSRATICVTAPAWLWQTGKKKVAANRIAHAFSWHFVVGHHSMLTDDTGNGNSFKNPKKFLKPFLQTGNRNRNQRGTIK